jgi:lipoprotein-anchoring transpeptidase ErfK/SrfK
MDRMIMRMAVTPKALATVALAALSAAVWPLGSASAQDSTVQIAQSAEIEVYYDDYGRRVIADARTGQILSIELPRNGLDRRATGTVGRSQDQRYLDEEYDRPRRGGEYDPRYDDERYERRREQRYPGEDEAYYDDRNAFPEAPAEPERNVKRKPLPQAPAPVREPVQPPVATQSEPRLSPANPADVPVIGRKANESVASLQIMLDRAGVSPGVIDGRMGSNVDKSLSAYNELTGDNLKTTDAAGIEAALAERGGAAFTEYTITQQDAAGPYVASIPTDYAEKAQLEAMSYTSTLEMLGERFHMSEAYLKELNPDANFNRTGTVIKVASTGSNVTRQVSRIIADKGREQVRAYDGAGRLVVAYPATIGSSDTPSPVGTHTVERIALNPEYTYNPKINFKQGENDKILRIPPGPNGPVGSVWIALSKPTYGIHGTPDPSKIGKTNSHGCIRLTNWDAQELAKLVKKGVTVEFVE